jgi:hypothetical protein
MTIFLQNNAWCLPAGIRCLSTIPM